MHLLGLDLGTQGARAMIVNERGVVAAQASEPFPSTMMSSSDGRFEQDMAVWHKAVIDVLASAAAIFRSQGHTADEIASLSVTSTSGTLCLVDTQGNAVRPAIMYSDTRATTVTSTIQQAGARMADKLGSKISASWALPRIVWVARNEPHNLARTRWAVSPTDMIIGWLTGVWGRSDWSNMLKTGYDVMELEWPDYIGTELGLPIEILPEVSSPGTPVAHISTLCASATGLACSTLVVSGATDGTASQLASGAVAPGQWNSTLGTTLVLKGVSERILRDPLGRIYCHRHPDGYWLPGGASSTGADCLTLRFGNGHLAELDTRALEQSPSGVLVYPLMRKGERFPFSSPEAEGFVVGDVASQFHSYAAHLEGIAAIERMCYETVELLGGVVGDTIHGAGGGSQSLAGLQIRADTLGRQIVVPEITAGAMGAAILALRAVTEDSLADAASHMVRTRLTVWPRREMQAAYDDQYHAFVQACRRRGYVV